MVRVCISNGASVYIQWSECVYPMVLVCISNGASVYIQWCECVYPIVLVCMIIFSHSDFIFVIGAPPVEQNEIYKMRKIQKRCPANHKGVPPILLI
jgi:hypothetical protein